MKRILFYLLAAYTLYLYLHDLLLGIYAELPVWDFIEKLDMGVILIGGIVSGVLLISTKKKIDKYFGIFMIISNLLIVPYLFMSALV